MTEIDRLIAETLQWIAVQNTAIIWLFLFFSNFAENVFPPWPGDTVTVLGGFLVAQNGNISWLSLLSSTFLGNLTGGFVMYKFGKVAIGWMKINNFPFKKSIYDEDQLQNTFEWFTKYKITVIVLSRFSAGIRFFVSIVAGMSKMNVFSFLFFFSLAIIIWCGLLIGGGFYLGKNWEMILHALKIYNRFVMAFIGIAIAMIVFTKFKKKSKQLKK